MTNCPFKASGAEFPEYATTPIIAVATQVASQHDNLVETKLSVMHRVFIVNSFPSSRFFLFCHQSAPLLNRPVVILLSHRHYIAPSLENSTTPILAFILPYLLLLHNSTIRFFYPSKQSTKPIFF